MAIKRYLAMTAAEAGSCCQLPPDIGWMACHFSPYGTGLSNIPEKLPPGSLLILNDRTPVHGHDPHMIAEQLEECITRLECAALLLDFQRPQERDIPPLINMLSELVSCPVIVSDVYGSDSDCPVFLPPVPPHTPLVQYLLPWQGRKIWLEVAWEGEIITLTPQGSQFSTVSQEEWKKGGHRDEKLHCHYQIHATTDQVTFSLHRTLEDLEALLEEGEKQGVIAAVGLWQDFHKTQKPLWNHPERS